MVTAEKNTVMSMLVHNSVPSVKKNVLKNSYNSPKISQIKIKRQKIQK